MKASLIALVASVLAFGLIVACGPSEEASNATSMQIVANIFATQTAGAPTSTLTPTETPPPTKTPTPTDTPAPTPTRTFTPTPNYTSTPATPISELNILWARWDPADYLQVIGEMYEAETGISVNVIQEPWGSFGDRFFTELAYHGNSWDMVAGDSQWLGQAATQGHYVELTDLLVGEEIASTVSSASLIFQGEYPLGSGRYWAYPTYNDPIGWAYRRDLFADPYEKATFEELHGYPLAVPRTYEQLMDIAEFFTRPEEGLYGIGIYTQIDYDALSKGFGNALFSWGADWRDENNEVLGVINSPEAIDAVAFYKDLYECCQGNHMSNAFFIEVNDAFASGQAAMIMNYFSFFTALVNPLINPHAETTGFFANPAGPNGDQYTALGGQSLSILNYISDERKEAAKEFIRWFARDDIQYQWALLGGFSSNKNVLNSQEFLNATPYNHSLAESMIFLKDYWRVPVFGELLMVSQRELAKYIVGGEGTAAETMNAIAKHHDQILGAAGLIRDE